MAEQEKEDKTKIFDKLSGTQKVCNLNDASWRR